MSRIPDSDQVEALLREVAAQEILPRFRCLQEGDIKEKAPGDLVTVADTEAERWLTPRLRALLPGSSVVGEEAVAADRGVLDQLLGEDPVWIIDPVDGTANFAKGDARFVVMVALARGGETIGGWIYDPVRNVMAAAEAGGGAMLDGRRLGRLTSACAPQVRRPDGSLGLRANYRLARKLGAGHPLVAASFGYHSAGQEYLALARGEVDLALYNLLMPWDHAAGQLLHREVGGIGRLPDGRPYTPRLWEGGLLLAPNEECWAAASEGLRRRGETA